MSGSSGDVADEEGSSDLWMLGVVLGLFGSIAINMGNNLQSLGMQRMQALSLIEAGEAKYHLETEGKEIAPEDVQPPNLCKSRTWVIGTTVFVSGSLLNFASFGFAAQSLLASLEAVQFVTNLMFGKYILGVTVLWRQVLGTIIIVVGTVLTVVFSSKASLKLGTNDMIDLYANPVFLAYCVLCVILAIVLHLTHVHYQRRVDEGDPLPRSSLILQCTYSTWSALFGTMSVVQAKCLAELLEVQADGSEAVFKHWFTYIVIAAWILLVAVWLYRMNEALSKYDPIFIIPLLQCNFIFFSVIAGGIYFREFDEFTKTMWAGFCSGIVVIFYGLYLLVPDEDKQLLPDENDVELAKEETNTGDAEDPLNETDPDLLTDERRDSVSVVPGSRYGSDATGGRRSDASLSRPARFSDSRRGSDRSLQRLSRASSISTIVTGIYDLSTGNIDVRASGNFLVVQGRNSQQGNGLRISIPHLTSMASMQTSRIYSTRASMDVDALTARSGRKSSAQATNREDATAKGGAKGQRRPPSGRVQVKKQGSVRTTLEGAGVEADSAAMVFMLGGIKGGGKASDKQRPTHERSGSREMNRYNLSDSQSNMTSDTVAEVPDEIAPPPPGGRPALVVSANTQAELRLHRGIRNPRNNRNGKATQKDKVNGNSRKPGP